MQEDRNYGTAGGGTTGGTGSGLGSTGSGLGFSQVHVLSFAASSGIVGAVAGFWPPGRDAYGFMALSGWSVFWSVECLWSWAAYDAPRAWVTALIWGTFALVVVIVAGMDEREPGHA